MHSWRLWQSYLYGFRDAHDLKTVHCQNPVKASAAFTGF